MLLHVVARTTLSHVGRMHTQTYQPNKVRDFAERDDSSVWKLSKNAFGNGSKKPNGALLLRPTWRGSGLANKTTTRKAQSRFRLSRTKTAGRQRSSTPVFASPSESYSGPRKFFSGRERRLFSSSYGLAGNA